MTSRDAIGAAHKQESSGTQEVPLFDIQLLNYKQAAACLGVSVRTLRRWKAAGLIPFIPFGIDDVRFRAASLDQWIKEREVS